MKNRLKMRIQNALIFSTLLITLVSAPALATWDGAYPVTGKNCSASGKKVQLVTVRTTPQGASIAFYATPYVSDDGLVLGKAFGNGDFSYQGVYKKRDSVKYSAKEFEASSVYLDSKSRPRKDPSNEYMTLSKSKKGELTITASTITKDIHCTVVPAHNSSVAHRF